MTVRPGQEWFSAAELAALSLPGIPAVAGKVQELSLREGWGARIDDAGKPLVRRRQGKGGGNEYHVSLLPGPAQSVIGWSAAAWRACAAAAPR